MSLNQRFINSIKSFYFHQTTFLNYNRKNTLPTAPHNLIGLEDFSFVALETTANKQRRRIDPHLQWNTGNTLSNKDNQLFRSDPFPKRKHKNSKGSFHMVQKTWTSPILTSYLFGTLKQTYLPMSTCRSIFIHK